MLGIDVCLATGGAASNGTLNVPVPWEPIGRTWSDRAGWFKDSLLNHAYGPGGAIWATVPGTYPFHSESESDD